MSFRATSWLPGRVPSSERSRRRWEEGWAGRIHRHLRTSAAGQCGRQEGNGERTRTLEHVLDEDGALYDLLVGIELLVIGSDEENHFEIGYGMKLV